MRKKGKKRILYGAIGAVFVLLFLALIVPSFIDVNQYKGLIANEVRSATGRTLTIEGDMDLSILPAPALSVHRLKLANLEGASSPDMVTLDALRVRIALFPLFTGRIQVKSISIIDPVIELERLSDGRANWEFTPEAKEEIAGAAQAPEKMPAEETARADADAPAQAIQVDRFTIENGTLVYRDGRSGTLERIEKINANVRAESLVGPFRMDGDLILRGMPVSLELGAGAFVEGPGTPIDLEVAIQDGGATLGFSGTLSAPNPTGVLTGNVKASGADLAGVVGTLADGASLPPLLAQEFSFESAFVGSSGGVALQGMSLKFGGAKAGGDVKIDLGTPMKADVAVSASKIDLDAWLGMQEEAARKTETPAPTTADGEEASSPQGIAKEKEAPAFAIPKDIDGVFSVTADSIIFQGAAIRDARLHASLADGELALDQATAQLPGGASFSLFGFVSAVKGAPHFEGDLDFRSKNLRSLFNWLQIDLAEVPVNRLRETALTAKLAVTPERASANAVKLTLDESHLMGTLSLAFTGRPDVRGNLSMDRLNLDAYLGDAKKSAAPGAAAELAAGSGKGATKAEKAKKAKDGKDALSGLKALEDFDADVAFALSKLTFRKQPISGIRLKGALKKGVLTLREASVQDLAGAYVMLSGNAGDFSNTPRFDAKLDLRAKEAARLFRLTGEAPPPAVARLGSAALKARFAGNLDRLTLDAALDAAKGNIRATGEVGNLPEAPDFDLRLAAAYPNLSTLLRVFDYRPRSKLGALDLKAGLKGTSAAIDLSGLDGHVGPVKLAGEIGVALDGPRPMVTARLESGEIPAHRFLPAGAGKAATSTGPAGTSASRQGQGQGGKASGRWSRTPLDLSGLRLLDADVDLSAVALLYDNLRVERPRVRLALKDGVLSLSKLSGNMFDGAFDASAQLADGAPATTNAKLAVKGANIRKALFASSGFDLGDGNLDFDLDLKTSGTSEYALVSALNGLVQFRVKDGVAKGFDLDAVSAKLDNLNNPEAFLGLLDTALSGGETRFQNLSGTVKVAKGIAQMENVRMQAQSGTADLSGKVDLPNWNMDLRSDFRLASEPEAPVFAMLLRGPLDDPKRRFDTKAFQKHLVKKGVGKLLKKVLPFKGPSAPESAAPTGKEEGEETAPPTEPEKVIKDLLKGFGF